MHTNVLAICTRYKRARARILAILVSKEKHFYIKTQWGTNWSCLFPIHFAEAVAAGQCQVTVRTPAPFGAGYLHVRTRLPEAPHTHQLRCFLQAKDPHGSKARKTYTCQLRQHDTNCKRTCPVEPAYYCSPGKTKITYQNADVKYS